MFGSISNKLKLKRKETEIKNLCANEREFLPILLKDTSAALLQVGLDFTSKPSLAIVCPLLKPIEFFDVMAKYHLENIAGRQVGISVCIFLGDDPVKIAHEYRQLLIESKYDLQTIKTDKSAGNNTSYYVNELTSNASICIKLPEFEFEAGFIIPPSEAAKRKEAEWEAEKIKREDEAERSGSNLIKSDAFKTAIKNLILDQNLKLGQSFVMNDLQMTLAYKKKFVSVPRTNESINEWGALDIDWEDLDNIGEANFDSNYVENPFAHLLAAEELIENKLAITREYSLCVGGAGYNIQTKQSFEFRINDNRKGIKPIEDTFGPISVIGEHHGPWLDTYRDPWMIEVDARPSLKQLMELYANRRN